VYGAEEGFSNDKTRIKELAIGVVPFTFLTD
jgi:hypothetical protein